VHAPPALPQLGAGGGVGAGGVGVGFGVGVGEGVGLGEGEGVELGGEDVPDELVAPDALPEDVWLGWFEVEEDGVEEPVFVVPACGAVPAFVVDRPAVPVVLV
jgi:hypothetical protein